MVVVCQERAPEQFDLGSATVVNPELPDGLLPVFVLDRYAGLEPEAAAGLHRRREGRLRRGERGRAPRAAAGRPVFTNHVLLGGPVGAATGAAVPRQGARLRARVLDARAARARGVGARDARARRGRRTSARSTSGASSRTSSARPASCMRCRRASTSTSSCSRIDAAALAALLEAARADPPNPGNAEERLPDDGNAERLAEFLAGDAPTVVYFGKLIEQKGVQVLLEAMADTRRAARGRRLRALPGARSRRSRPSARSSPARSSIATSCTCCRSPT